LPAKLALNIADCVGLFNGRSKICGAVYFHGIEDVRIRAQEIRDAWDPVKQKMRELEEQQQAQFAEEVSIEVAVERWLKSICAEIENKHTQKKYGTTARKILSWAIAKKFVVLSQVRTDALDEWKTQWSLNAKRPDDCMGKNGFVAKFE